MLLEITVSGAVSDDEAYCCRPQDRNLAAGQDRGVRPRPKLGNGARRGRLCSLERRLRAPPWPELPTVAFDGDVACSSEAYPRAPRPSSRVPPSPSISTSVSDPGRRVPRLRPNLRLRPAERGVHDLSRVVLKLGGGVAVTAARHALDLFQAGDEVVVVHGAGPQINAELRAAWNSCRIRERSALHQPSGPRHRARVAGRRRGRGGPPRSAPRHFPWSAMRSVSRPRLVPGSASWASRFRRGPL